MSKKLYELQAEIDGYMNAIVDAEKALEVLRMRLSIARQEKHAEELRIAQAKPLTPQQKDVLEAIAKGATLTQVIGWGHKMAYWLCATSESEAPVKVSPSTIAGLQNRRFIANGERLSWRENALTITDAGRAKLEGAQ